MVDELPVKLSDYVADFIAAQGTKCVFAVSGGASLHLIHSVANHAKLHYVCTHHEQSAAMSADAYARVTGNLGVAIATSGPGATNLITGICCSFYDSVPVLLVTGQVSTFRMVGDTGVRQIGFQETPITDICQSITKYACQIRDSSQIRYELEKAVYISRSGRPGPVIIDIPDNLQRSQISVATLEKYTPDNFLLRKFPCFGDVKHKFVELITSSKRPVLIAGWGIHLSRTKSEFVKLAELLNVPVALTWGAADILPADHPLYVGTFGTHGMRHANFAVQNADLIISLGSRLDTKSTGSPINTFSRGAKKIVVDIDPHELGKFSYFGLDIDLLIQEDLVDFFREIQKGDIPVLSDNHRDWITIISRWKQDFLSFDRRNVLPTGLDPYEFMDKLSIHTPDQSQVFVDTGCAIAWTMQNFRFSRGQRLFHDFNNTAMGWALPAAIGGFFARPDLPLVCIVGDGSLMMSLHELATVKHHRIPIKLILLNNSGYSMIRQTQDQWLDSKYYASSHEGGLSFPDYKALATAFGFDYVEIACIEDCSEKMGTVFLSSDPLICNVIIPPDARVIPQVKFGRPNEDMEPLLPRDLFLRNMIVNPLDVSKSY